MHRKTPAVPRYKKKGPQWAARSMLGQTDDQPKHGMEVDGRGHYLIFGQDI